MVALSYADVSYAYPLARGTALADLTLEIDPGDVVLCVGSSGSGKSTLLRAANGIVPHTTGGVLRGEVTVHGRSTRAHRPRDLADVVGYVHQDPEAAFVVDRVEDDIAFALENLGMDQTAMRRRVEEVLDALAIAHLRDRSPATLSGGEQQRAAIAAALAAGPASLVLDEPTSQLDPQGAEDVLAALARLNADLGTTVVVAEHRLHRAGPLADRVLRVDAGRLVADGTPAQVLPDYPGAAPVTRLGRLLGWDPVPLTVREARRAARGTMLAVPEPDRASGPTPGDVVLAARGLDVARGPRRVLAGVDLELRAGEVVALMGRNGAGKSSLLRTLAGLDAPAAGAVARLGPAAHGGVAFVPQDPNLLLSRESVADEVAHTLRLLRRHEPAAVHAALAANGLVDLADRHPRALSGGQRQRVAIAAVTVGDAAVVLLDEPTRGMDAEAMATLEQVIAAHAADGRAIVLATHDVELAARVATRVVLLADGELVADGPSRDVLAGSLFAPQVLRVLPPFLTVEDVAAARTGRAGP